MRFDLKNAVSTGILLGSFVVTSSYGGDFVRTADAIPESYIVVLKSDGSASASFPTAAAAAQSLADSYSVQSEFVYEHSISGFSIKATESQARLMAQDPSVAYVVEDGVVSASATQSPATWGLDRIDQRAKNLNNTYLYDETGERVNAYVIDSGIRSTHSEFGGRVDLDFSSINDGNGASDCYGHGTHVAGIIGGATYGVAKKVRLHSVRVLGCNGRGTWSGVIAGIDWVTSHAQKPAVVNMSLGGGANQATDDAVRRSIKAGITYVIAAGNNYGRSACDYSPARTREAITVGATDKADSRADYSNIGTCVDLFAPGSNILSAWGSSDTAIKIDQGTSMAAPHVAGVAALLLQNHSTASPAAITNGLERMVSVGKVVNRGAGSPNHLLYSRSSTINRYPFFRYFNNRGGDHFYTTSWNELGGGFGAWNYEGVQGYLAPTQIANTDKLYRYYNTKNGDHFYTTNWSELGAGGNNGWVYEGVAGYVPTVVSADTAKLHRYFNTTSGDHFYTTNWNELGAGGGSWRYEGVQCLIYTKP